MSELTFAIDLVDDGAEVARAAFVGADAAIETKPDGSPVTNTDLAIEDLIRARLAEHRPADAILGEERPPRSGTSGRRWVIDPLGGTAHFIRRVPLFSVDLALEDADGPAVAVSCYPVGEVMLAAERGTGCWVFDHAPHRPAEHHRARVSDRRSLDDAVVSAHRLHQWPADLLDAVHRRCRLRDSVHSVVRLLRGETDAVVIPGGGFGYDDLAGVPVLIEEAGGRVTDFNGVPLLEGDGTVLATNGHLHDALLELIASTTRT